MITACALDHVRAAAEHQSPMAVLQSRLQRRSVRVRMPGSEHQLLLRMGLKGCLCNVTYGPPEQTVMHGRYAIRAVEANPDKLVCYCIIDHGEGLAGHPEYLHLPSVPVDHLIKAILSTITQDWKKRHPEDFRVQAATEPVTEGEAGMRAWNSAVRALAAKHPDRIELKRTADGVLLVSDSENVFRVNRTDEGFEIGSTLHSYVNVDPKEYYGLSKLVPVVTAYMHLQKLAAARKAAVLAVDEKYREPILDQARILGAQKPVAQTARYLHKLQEGLQA